MATGLSGISKQLRAIRQNAVRWCGLFLGIFALLLLYFFKLQILQHRAMLTKAEKYHARTVSLPATRGRLLDRNLTVLALDDRRLSLYADPTLIRNPAFTAKQLAPVINVPEQELYDLFTLPCARLWLKRDVSKAVADRVTAAKLAGVTVRVDGWCYAITITSERLPHSGGITRQLAEALRITPEALVAQIGDPEAEPDDTAPPPAPPAPGTPPSPKPKPVTKKLKGLFPEGCRRAVEELHFSGVAFKKVMENYSVEVSPRAYQNPKLPLDAEPTAKLLATLLDLSEDDVMDRLHFKQRFVWVKRGMSEEMLQRVQRLQGTMWVAEPGQIEKDIAKRANDTDDDAARRERDLSVAEAMDDAVKQLDYAINRLTRSEKLPPLVTTSAIRDALQPGAKPGILYQSEPSLKITRYMFSYPVPGVMYGLPGVSVQQERRRYYPYATLASATLGLVKYGANGAYGVFGLEATQNERLHGVDGSEDKEIDGRQMTIPERSRRVEPANGRDVVLTIDLHIQQVAERALKDAVEQYGALRGTCIALDPANGEILALANWPAWDANAPSKSKQELINNAISNVYEPGSTFKLVAATAGLEEGLAHDGVPITNCRGALAVGGAKPFRDAHGAHGPTDPGRMLEVSCNIAAATMAMRLGSERFQKWCKKYNFSTRTGVELAGEARGRMNAEEIQKKATLARMGFGQSLNVTPLQMVSAYAAVANGGEWHQPHLVKGYVDARGNVQEVDVPHHTVCSPKTAALLRGYLERVVGSPHGTGGNAKIANYRPAGKTGTAQKVLGGGQRGYSGYIGSFVGFVPFDKPRIAIVAVIDAPSKGGHYGGTVAAPVFQAVGRDAMEYLNVSPSLPVHSAPATTPAHH